MSAAVATVQNESVGRHAPGVVSAATYSVSLSEPSPVRAVMTSPATNVPRSSAACWGVVFTYSDANSLAISVA